MNVIQQCRRIDFHTDKVKSPRWFYDTSYVPALNIAMTEFIRDRYNNIKKQQKTYGFETSQSLKDDLRTITNSTTIVPTGNKLIALPADYHHELTLFVTINGVRVPSNSITHNEKGALYENSNTRPSVEYPVHIEDQNGITVLFGGYGTFTLAEMDYLRVPVSIVANADPADRTQLLNILPPGPLVVGNMYYVTQDGTVHNGVTYVTGDTFIAVAAMFGPGRVSRIVNCELPDYTHEEISLMAAASLTGRAMNLLKSKLLSENEDSV